MHKFYLFFALFSACAHRQAPATEFCGTDSECYDQCLGEGHPATYCDDITGPIPWWAYAPGARP